MSRERSPIRRSPQRKHTVIGALETFLRSEPDLLVVPIERITPRGLAPPERDGEGLCADRRQLIGAGFALYWQRCTALFQRAPMLWFPPRRQHLCFARADGKVRPYSQPLHRASWLLEEADLDPARSNAEFLAYQILHAERMGLVGSVTEALALNSTYWALLDDPAVEAFRDACYRSSRSDRDAYRVLADALPAVRRELVAARRARGAVATKAGSAIPGLLHSFAAEAERTLASYHRRFPAAGADSIAKLCDELALNPPHVLVSAGSNAVVWDPAEPDATTRLRSALAPATAAGVERIGCDLRVIHRCSQDFRASLRDPDALPLAGPDAAQSGLCFAVRGRAILGYDLDESGMERRRTPAPPFERTLLAGRATHEWAHLAVEAGWVPLRQDSVRRHREHLEALAEEFRAVLLEAPDRERGRFGAELSSIGAGEPALRLVRVALARTSDFRANLLAVRYLRPEERETYVRSNVYSHVRVAAPFSLFPMLARYAFEYQYLQWAEIDDPWDYFAESTWFRSHYLDPGILRTARAKSLFAAVGRVLAGYRVDESRFLRAGGHPDDGIVADAPNR